MLQISRMYRSCPAFVARLHANSCIEPLQTRRTYSQPRITHNSKQPLTIDREPTSDEENSLRMPRAVQAIYLKPLRRTPQYGVPVCDLQLRSYNVRNLEFFCDFALRAAYYLNLPASGPVPLPRITERWTVPKGVFIHKKSQENFERRTVRRLIQIKDGHVESVELWLAFLRKHAYYGIGMKANIFEFSKLGMSDPFCWFGWVGGGDG